MPRGNARHDNAAMLIPPGILGDRETAHRESAPKESGGLTDDRAWLATVQLSDDLFMFLGERRQVMSTWENRRPLSILAVPNACRRRQDPN